MADKLLAAATGHTDSRQRNGHSVSPMKKASHHKDGWLLRT
jgi:hypothetical protein